MAISKTLVVSLNQDKARAEEKMFIYRGDVGVDIYIELSNLTYQFDKKKNNFKYVNALFKVPSGEVHEINDLDIKEGKIKFTFSKDIVKNMQELGKYELQFQLFDNIGNRLSIPSYYFEVKEPLGITDMPSAQDGARVDYAKVGYAHVADSVNIFSIEDGYIKTVWETGDLITASKLNNIEEGISALFKELENIKNGEGSSSSSSVSSKLKTLDKKVTSMSTKIEELGITVNSSNSNISALRTSINKLKSELEKLELNLNAKISEIQEDINDIKENGGGSGSLIYDVREPSTIALGGIGVGYVPPEGGISVIDLLDQAMHPYIYKAPSISFSMNPNTTLYELGHIVSNLNLIVNVTKGKEPITEVGILQNGATIKTSTSSFSHTLANINKDTSFSAYVTDGIQRVNSNTLRISFINPIYIGVLTNITEQEIKSMTKKIVNVSSQSYTYTLDTKRMCIAIPSGWNLKSIIDPNNFNITSSFASTNVNITCLDNTVRPYTVYYSDYTSQNNFLVKFNF